MVKIYGRKISVLTATNAKIYRFNSAEKSVNHKENP